MRAVPDLAAFEGADWPPLISVLLAHRGVRSHPEAVHYLGEPGELTNAELMPNLDVAVERLGRACDEAETVAVFGDFDVDGLTATTILTEGLRDLGARPLPYIPDRFAEGYGPNPGAIRELHAQGASVLVTADCGTSAVHEVGVANELGMDVNHHRPPHCARRRAGRARAREPEAQRLAVRLGARCLRGRAQGRPRPLRSPRA